MTTETTNSALPNDVAQCHALIVHMATRLDKLTATLQEQEREKARLLHRVEMLLQQIYGRRSEKIDPAQLLLFVEQVMAAAAKAEAEPEPETGETTAHRKGHGRQKLPVELPRLPIEHPVPDSDKVCAQCGKDKTRIGQDVSEQLEYAPASFFIIEHIRPKYACPCCQDGVTTASKPAQPIEKGLPGPALMAHVSVSKYCDHQPLYRQETILARHGVYLSRKTLWGWVWATAMLLEAVVEAMRIRVLQSKVIHTDDTPVTVQARGGGTYTGRFWVYAGDAQNPYIVYDYTPSRRRDGPVTFLREFVGTPEAPRYLQADAFGGYDGIYAADNGVFEVACWAHARRKFHDARKSDVNRAHQMLAWIQQLYLIEREAKDLDVTRRRALRLEKSKPTLDTIKTWLDAQQSQVLPKSPIGEAFQYAQNQWTALNRYLDDGDLSIDNNVAERSLRGIALGRKNYLFMGSDRGGRAAAILYSLIHSAKRHDLDPFVYLRDLLLRIPTHPNKDIHLLLPDQWKTHLLPEATAPFKL
jgi:transposase